MEGNGFVRPSAEKMDENRIKQVGYQYLCHLEEAKVWLEKVLNRRLPPALNLEENLRNGVILARLGHFVTPEVVPLGSIYDPDQKRYEAIGLNFRHTDNINLWLRALQRSGFPRIFLPEVPDVYDKKNMPKVIYCIHALSAHLFRMGLTPQMHDLYGKVQFTDDAISNICKELKESGVTMPAFQKISGLFTQDIDPVGSSLESAVGAVNDAVDQGSSRNLLLALSDPKLQLRNLKVENIEKYMDVLSAAKREKCETSLNKSLNGSCEVDENDDLLKQPEIQGHILAVNLDSVCSQISEAFLNVDEDSIRSVIKDNSNEFGQEYDANNLEFYVMVAKNVSWIDFEAESRREVLFNIVRQGNYRAEEHRQVNAATENVLKILENGYSDELLQALKQPCLKLESIVKDFAGPLYYLELREYMQFMKTGDLSSCISSLNLIAAVTEAVETRDPDAVWHCLCKLNEHFAQALDLPMTADSSLRMNYFRYLEVMRNEKLGMENDLLTLDEIENGIELAKAAENNHVNELRLVQEINACVRNSNAQGLVENIQCLIPEVKVEDVPVWALLLQCKLEERRFQNQELWLNDIKDLKDHVFAFKREVAHRIRVVEELREAAFIKDGAVLKHLLLREGFDCPLKDEVVLEIFKELQQQDVTSGQPNWVQEQIFGRMINVDIDQGTICPVTPTHASSISAFSTSKIQNAILNCAEADSRMTIERKNGTIIRLQAAIRGYLLRKQVQRWRAAAIIIQRWWRLRGNPKICLKHYLNHVKEIKIIQDSWRRRQIRRAMEISPTSSCKNLNLNEGADAVEELIQKLRSQVMEKIKRNQDLSKKVDEMDIRIGLLVRNRISISAVVAERRNQKKIPFGKPNGIRALCKDKKLLLDGYQKLFYLLQTRPKYLSRLITQSPSNLTIQNCIMNLFNMGSSARDAYLLLKLLANALHEEVNHKLQKPGDVVTGNPLVLKLAVGFARQIGGQHPLQYILAPLIYKVLEEQVILDTNPVDIYRRWMNEAETSSGCPSSLPRNVTQDVALSHPEVKQRLQRNIDLLKTWVKEFLTRLAENTHRFPYALKFIAKTLQEALKEKFIDITEKDILKIVGHLIYYQYVNSALVAPDAFHIISLGAQQPLRAEQRKNLASIAKILQFSASKNGFGEESQHLMQLNPFIIECHDVMKQMSRDCCQVPSLEEHFHVSHYSEALLLRRPRVYMTVQELCQCHLLLTQQRTTVAPDPIDPIHDILDDLREVPTPADLLGCTEEMAANIQVEKTLICLELDIDFLTEPGKVRAKGDENHKHLRREAQIMELNELKATLNRLHEKTRHFEEQLHFYEKYLEACLSNLTLRKRNKSSRAVKYTAAQLIEKGILVNLDSVPSNQLKNVQFEVTSTDVKGRFRVQCHYMGVEVDTADIDIQHLLSLQFEGRGVLRMFGKAEINVNLLLYLLNKKFIRQTGTGAKKK